MKPDDLPAHIQAAARAAPATAMPHAPLVLEWQALALGHERFAAAATAVTTELALRLGCTRVSLAWRDAARPGRPAQVAAISHGGEADQRHTLTRRLTDAADEALDSGQPAVELPLREPRSAGPTVAHAALLSHGGAACVLSLPFDAEGSRPGVFVFESAVPLAPAERQLAADAALFVGPLLMLQARVDAPWLERARAVLFGATPDASRFSHGRIAVASALLGVTIAAFWPSTRHVVAEARLEGHGQRSIAAPADGFLATVAVRPGERVKAGQVLATLEDREARLELERAGAEHSQAERQYRDALTRDDAGPIVAARARFEQAQAQLGLAQARLERTRLVAPFDGVLIAGDLAPSVGLPVRRGQELMIVTPGQGWRVVAEVDEADVLAVQPGQKAQLVFSAIAGEPATFDIARVAPVAVAAGGRNVFEAEGRLDADITGLRPGLRGVARIEAGIGSPALGWWENGRAWLRRTWWAFVS